MKKNRSLISVIIPVYNCENYLGQAIESALAQTYTPIEIIVVNDGSTDKSLDIAQNFTCPEVRVHSQVNKGLGYSRNKGVELAAGEYFAFLDADDLWLPEKLTLQHEVLMNQEIDMVFSDLQQFISPELSNHSKKLIKGDQMVSPGYIASTLLIKKSAFEKAGPFATNWRVGEFIDWYSKGMEHGLKQGLVSQVLAKRRLHSNNMGIREKNSRTDYLRVVKAAMERKRKAAL